MLSIWSFPKFCRLFSGLIRYFRCGLRSVNHLVLHRALLDRRRARFFHYQLGNNHGLCCGYTSVDCRNFDDRLRDSNTEPFRWKSHRRHADKKIRAPDCTTDHCGVKGGAPRRKTRVIGIYN